MDAESAIKVALSKAIPEISSSSLTTISGMVAIPVLDSMGFTNYQVTDKEHIHIFERLNESAALNMELAKSGIPVKGISITSEELETYFLNLTGGADHA